MSTKKTFLLLLICIVILLIISFSYYFQSFILGSIENFGNYLEKNKIFGAILFTGVSAFSILLSPFTSVPLVPSAILAWGSLLTFFLLIGGWTLGSILAYFIGSYSREKIIKKFTSFKKVEYYKKNMSGHLQFGIVLFFRLAVPSEIASYTLGIIRYNFSRYLIATLLAEMPFAFFVIYSSSILIGKKIFFFVCVIVLGGICFYFFYKSFRKKMDSWK